ncbi:MAG: chorismate mutase [Chloroflexi bacterium]|nr:chorismate mutase [Chloroflexota bacterium]
MALRGIRGATTASDNTEAAILQATSELLQELERANKYQLQDLAAVWFSATSDLNAVFPAKAARLLGWARVPLFDAVEIDVPGSLPRCIRVLLLWNTDIAQDAIRHIYLKGASGLRPDLTEPPSAQEEK